MLLSRTLLLLLTTAAVCTAQQQKTWTFDADFDQGVMINVNHESVNDQLQLDHESISLPFVNVAASKRGTIIRIDATTGEIVGEYRSAPLGELHNPSRTTVDREGNVWAANRDQPAGPGEGSVVKIGIVLGGTRCDKNGTPDPGGAYLKPPYAYSTAVDRDGDGLIRTSRGLGDIHAWIGISGAEAANDECIILYKKLPAHHCRHLSIDADNNVWSGGYSRNDPLKTTMMKLEGSTGDILSLHEDLSCGGYGGFVSRSGMIFSSSMSGGSGPLLMLSPSGSATCIPNILSYGLAEGSEGNVWATTFNDGKLFKLSPVGTLIPGFPVDVEGTWPRGAAVTKRDGHIWIACSGSNTVERRDTTGALLKAFDFAAHSPAGILPTGVAVDANGKVWVTNARSDNVFRIDPDGGVDHLGSIDMEVYLGLDAYPYNYSDMTGAALGENIPRYGSWRVVHDGVGSDLQWQRVSWNDALQGDAEIHVRARAANVRSALPTQQFVEMRNGELRCDGLLEGRFIEVLVEFYRGSSKEQNPILYDLTIDGSEIPTVGFESLVFCEGDSVRISADPRFNNVEWNDGSFTLTRWVSKEGTYWYNGIGSLGCLMTSDTIHVTTRQAPQPVIVPDTVTICRGENTTLLATPGYRWYSWSPVFVGDSSNSLRVNQPGSYTVTVVDSLGCIGTSAPVVVRWHPKAAITLVPEGDTVLCQDQQLLLRATPGFPEYRWSTGLTGAVDSLLITEAGLYRVSVTDSNGCEGRSNAVQVSFAPPIAFDLWIDGAMTICEGDSAVLRATPGFRRYLWSTGASGSSDSLVVSGSGSYSVTVVDRYGCSASSDSVNITVLPPPQIDLHAVGDSAFCDPGSVQLQATPGFERYFWSMGEESDSASIRVTASGVYRVSVVGPGGCPGTSNPVTVKALPPPELQLWMNGGFVLCRETEGILRVTPGYPHYRWSTGESGPETSLTISDSGRYWVSAQNEFGCIGYSDTVVVYISDKLLPEISRGSDTLCVGGSLLLDAGPGYATYEWNTGETTQRITITQAGLYNVHVTSQIGCEGDTSVVIYTETLPSIFSDDLWLCRGESTVLDAGPGFASYRWNTGDTTESVNVSAAGRYIVSVTSTRGCVMEDTIVVYAHPRPMISIAGENIVCRGFSEQYALTAPVASTVRWTTGTGGRIDGSDSAASVLLYWDSVGTHPLSISFIDAVGGCRFDSTIWITVVDAPPIFIAGELEFCAGDSTRLQALGSFSTCSWITPLGEFAGNSLQVTVPGLYILKVVSVAGCTGYDTVTVVEHPLPRPSVSGVTVIDEGDSTVLELQQEYSVILWTLPHGGQVVGGRRITAHDSGRYSVAVTTEAGCTAETAIHVHFNPGLEASAVIVLPELVADPGDKIDIHCQLRSWSGLDDIGAAAWSAELRYDARIMVPMGNTSAGWVEGNDRVIPLGSTWSLHADTLASMEFLVLLGPVSSSPLRLSDFTWDQDPVRTTLVDGLLQVRICREGGERLFDAEGRLRLEQNHPNPFNAETRIDFELIEAGHTELRICDMLGRCVATLVSGYYLPGSYRATFNAERLPSGSYLCILRTPTAVRLRRMHLLK